MLGIKSLIKQETGKLRKDKIVRGKSQRLCFPATAELSVKSCEHLLTWLRHLPDFGLKFILIL